MIEPTAQERLTWRFLLALYLLFGLLYCCNQPPGGPPDEKAHLEYVQFLVRQHRLPVWAPTGAEGGYETQHPVLAYLYMTLFYGGASGSAEPLRWLAVRLGMLALGVVQLVLARRLGQTLWPDRPTAALALAATIGLVPLSLNYLTHANPDGLGLVLSTAGLLWLAQLWQRGTVTPRDAITAGAFAGVAGLIKLSVLPLAVVLLAALLLLPGDKRRTVALFFGTALLLCGGWYLRNKLLYGSFFIHTPSRLGSGLEMGRKDGIGPTLLLVARESFLSLWAQRGWFPKNFDVPVAAPIFALLGLAGVGLWRGPERQRTQRPLWRLAALFLVLLVIGHQAAFWTADMEFNAGGRYLLIGLPALAILIVGGVSAWGQRVASPVLVSWMVFLVVLNLIAIKWLNDVLVPTYYPGWSFFHFPPTAGGGQ